MTKTRYVYIEKDNSKQAHDSGFHGFVGAAAAFTVFAAFAIVMLNLF